VNSRPEWMHFPESEMFSFCNATASRHSAFTWTVNAVNQLISEKVDVQKMCRYVVLVEK